MEFLRELLGEELYAQLEEKVDGVDKVQLANVADGSYIPKAKFNSVNEQVKALRGQVTDRESQLQELKALEPQKMQGRILELEQSNKTQRDEYEKMLSQQAFDYALKRAIAKSGARNMKALMALLDTDAITLDGESVLGLDEQIEMLKQSDGYLFDLPKATDTGATNPATVKKSGLDKEKMSDAQFFAQIFK